MESIKFDLMGYRRLEFDDQGVAWRAKELYPIPLPGRLATVTLVTDEVIPYREIVHIGAVVRRQPWALVLGVIGCLLGALVLPATWGDWPAFGTGAGIVALIGIWPLLLFARGRRFLLIASDRQAISLPMDRKKAKVRRALEILKERCGMDGPAL